MLQLLGVIIGLLVTNLVLLSPLNLSSATRRLIEKLGRETLLRNYLVLVLVLTLTQVTVGEAQILISGRQIDGTAVFVFLGFSTVGVTWIYALVAGLVLPWKNIWNASEEDEIDGRIVIALNALLYGASAAAFSFLLMILAIAFFFPG